MCTFTDIYRVEYLPFCLSVSLPARRESYKPSIYVLLYLLLDTKTAEKNTSNTKMVMQKI